MTASSAPQTGRPGRAILAVGFGLWLAAFAAMFLQHTMWRDELQAWQIATASRTPLDVYWNMRTEGHPGLWHLLLWLGAQVSTDPVVFRVIQVVIALAILVIVAFRSPFSWLEKLLVMSSYFLIFLYSVVARSYGLGVLLLFLAIHAHAKRATPPWLSWLFLGLAANTSLFGAFASIAFASGFVLERPRRLRQLAPCVALYSGLLAIAVIWMMPPAADIFPAGRFRLLSPGRIVDVWNGFVLAFAPIDWPPSRFLGPQLQRLVGEMTGAPRAVTIALVAPAVFVLALKAIDERGAQMVFATAFAFLFAFFYARLLGSGWHNGTFFIAFVGCVWLARAHPPRATARVATMILFSLNALGGLIAVDGALSRPFSMGQATAAFIRTTYRDDVFLAGYRDSQVSTVAGYLARPIYYPQCDCVGSFVRWGKGRVDELPLNPDSILWARLQRRMAADGISTGVLVLSREANIAAVAGHWPGLSLVLRRAFTGAVMADEQFFVYDVRLDTGARSQ